MKVVYVFPESKTQCYLKESIINIHDDNKATNELTMSMINRPANQSYKLVYKTVSCL